MAACNLSIAARRAGLATLRAAQRAAASAMASMESAKAGRPQPSTPACNRPASLPSNSDSISR